jgi:hypothetical protein
LCNAGILEGVCALMYRGFVGAPVYSTFMSVFWRFVLGASLRTEYVH